MKPRHYPEPEVDVWPEAWAAIQLFGRIWRQWRVGPGGPYALDDGVVRRELRRMKLSPEERDEMLDQLRVIEGAALEEIHRG